MTVGIHVLIATAGGPTPITDTLTSLAESGVGGLSSVRVVENGPPRGVRDACRRHPVASVVAVETCHIDRPNKSAALNRALEDLDDEQWVLMTDDDVRFRSGWAAAYRRRIVRTETLDVFGGPFDVRYEHAPPPELRRYLPPSALGWRPAPGDYDGRWFLGFNWAANVGRLRAAGGFDPDYGPGSPTGASGQETEMQRRLTASGANRRYVEDASVTHLVPAEKCSTQWVLHRALRNGTSRGQLVNRRRWTRRVTEDALQWTRRTWTGIAGDRFHAAHERRRVDGYFQARRADRERSPQRK